MFSFCDFTRVLYTDTFNTNCVLFNLSAYVLFQPPCEMCKTVLDGDMRGLYKLKVNFSLSKGPSEEKWLGFIFFLFYLY